MTISFAQIAADALANWLTQFLSSDIQVLSRWPANATDLTTNSLGRIKTVSITKVGRRRRLDCIMPIDPLAVTPIGGAQAQWTFPIGGLIQPLQIDIWCAYDPDRDDVLDQMDDALTAGTDQTIGPSFPDNPIRDGILLAMNPENGYTGYLDYWFDEPDIDDNPNSVQRVEFRATFLGDARGTLARVRQAPILQAATLKTKASEQSPPPAGQPYDTVTITSSGVTYGTSNS